MPTPPTSPKDLTALGIDPGMVTTWTRRGDVERVARGLYRRADAELTGRETLAMVARLVPDGVFCLGTALHFHAIGTDEADCGFTIADALAVRGDLAGQVLDVGTVEYENAAAIVPTPSARRSV